MKSLRVLVARFAGLFRHRRRDCELEEEIASHFRMHVDDNIRAGMTEAEAQRAAQLAFGSTAAMREEYRDRRTLPWIETFLRDLRFGLRMLLKSWGLSATAIAALVLGIGCNIVIFGLANALFLREPPVREPARVVRIYESRYRNIPWRSYEEYQRQNRSFDSLAMFQMASISVRLGGEAEHAFGMTVSANCFATLGVHASHGRLMTEEDVHAPVAVLSDAAWRSRFGANPGILGGDIRINGHRYTVIGVAPAGFGTTFAPFAPELWIPWQAPGLGTAPGLADDNRSGHMIGRLKPDVSRAQAQADLSRIEASFERPRGTHSLAVSVYPASTLGEMDAFAKVFVGLLAVLSGGLLLVTCVNLATLLLARGSSRTNEIATRLALGAGRSRIVAQLLAESLILATAGAAAALAIATVVLRTLATAVSSLPTPIPIGFAIAADWRVVFFSVGTAIATTLIFGLAPALRTSRPNLTDSLQARSASTGREKSRLRAFLMGAQVAMSVLLLATGAALVASLFNARTLDRGFDATGVLTASLDLHNYDAAKGAQFVETLRRELAGRQGIRAANVVRMVPLMLSNRTSTLMKEGQPAPPPQQWSQLEQVYSNAVSPGHFETLGIRLIAGRDFDGRDAAGRPAVAIVNETLARRLWPGENPVGRRLRPFNYDAANSFGAPVEVIGVARDSKYVTLMEEPKAFAYFTLAQSFEPELTLLVKTQGDPSAALHEVREAMRAADRDIPLFGISTLSADTALSLLPVRIAAVVSVAISLVALILVVIGIFGVVAFLVRQRTREIGIRMALGAHPGELFRSIAGEPIRWTLVGFAVGASASLLLTRALGSVFRGVAGSDPLALLAVAAVVPLTVIAAAYLPARQAIRSNPSESLRS